MNVKIGKMIRVISGHDSLSQPAKHARAVTHIQSPTVGPGKDFHRKNIISDLFNFSMFNVFSPLSCFYQIYLKQLFQIFLILKMSVLSFRKMIIEKTLFQIYSTSVCSMSFYIYLFFSLYSFVQSPTAQHSCDKFLRVF